MVPVKAKGNWHSKQYQGWSKATEGISSHMAVSNSVATSSGIKSRIVTSQEMHQERFVYYVEINYCIPIQIIPATNARINASRSNALTRLNLKQRSPNLFSLRAG